jgi:putative acetyltransferase
MTTGFRIEAERDAHRPLVLDLTRAAFGGTEEVLLIERLTRDGLVEASLVAVAGDTVVGHILFSRLDVLANGAKIDAAALAPLAVSPDHRRRGIGSALVRAGLDVMRRRGIAAVIVLGHEHFYPRFGFSHDVIGRLACPFTHLAAFMGLELTAGAIGGKRGTCVYPPAFGL